MCPQGQKFRNFNEANLDKKTKLFGAKKVKYENNLHFNNTYREIY